MLVDWLTPVTLDIAAPDELATALLALDDSQLVVPLPAAQQLTTIFSLGVFDALTSCSTWNAKGSITRTEVWRLLDIYHILGTEHWFWGLCHSIDVI